jgi:hypothetical protein
VTIHVRLFNHDYSGSTIQCSCSDVQKIASEQLPYNRNLYLEDAKKLYPSCNNCKTDIMIWNNENSFIRWIEKRPNFFDFEFYSIQKKHHLLGPKDAKIEKLTRVQMDFLHHKLFIERKGVMLEAKSKTGAKNLWQDTFGTFRMSHFLRDMGGDQMTPVLDYIFGSSKDGELLFQYIHYMPIQILVNAGYGKWTTVLFSKNAIDSTKTTPHEILDLSKSVMPFFKSFSLNNGHIKTLRQISKFYNNQDLQSGLELIFDEYPNMDWYELYYFLNFVNEEKPASFQKFARYVFIEAKHRQGITSPEEVCKLLKDSYSMAREMEVEFDTMSKSLKIMHDVLAMNYKVARTEIEQKKFKQIVEDEHYQKLVYENDVFKIITPTSGDDLIREGQTLSHCVASYFNRVVNKESKIYFLRHKDRIYEPLVTIEVCKNRIHQAAGRSNRSPKDTEKKFISEWAKENQLKYS